ncbi:SNG1 family protein [Aspergillus luchuensis]|uniref:Nitrosoguanidine resistance protein SNG1 n=1 Tax=Aspergillus kawachii TaxID=1069201 RepID=A0A146FRW5_ASPKA|nr:uncharacterized protein AKAW2_30574A [Aspergillus luchuensis]BCR97255.1 hypothetical protein AKAW2_30574A [Aspergillus luchuensis]BCS09721.1 hypothetical protein ALUC_30538A [Aspergillus luchuensis]GAA88454.1 nitrosoguanidine resistance protein SNG1 [Aspergillus luchuensis IFO 4308]GAT28436.1 nitrosoguanidine resistance protein SNG1 [Aspergillus luchuensis]
MKVLYVDFDQGISGKSLLKAYELGRSPAFPTIEQHSIAEYATEDSLKRAVCKEGYWGAIYAKTNASLRLSTAIASRAAVENYNNADALGYVWNGAKYAAYAQTVHASLTELVQVTGNVYSQANETSIFATVNVSNPSIASTLLQPIASTETDLLTTDQGTRFYYNTVSMVMPINQQFFFSMAFNGISMNFNLFAVSLTQLVSCRALVAFVCTFISALAMSGYIRVFREGWDVHSSQFGLTWMTIWLAMQVHYLLLEFVTTFVPIPFAILTWVILNILSTLSPFELSPGFYRWGYALPSRELYDTLLQVWTRGCNPYLGRSLPILWSWWIVGVVGFAVALRYRHQTAMKAEVQLIEDEKSEGPRA